MSKYLIDSDAWLALRKLSVLGLMITAGKLADPLLMCEYAARHELSSLCDELSNLEKQSLLRVCSVQGRMERSQIRSLIKEGAHKGEAEAVVWALDQDRDCRPFFISVDRRARQTARQKGLFAGDIFDLIVDLLEESVIVVTEVQPKLLVWEDRKQQIGRPSDYTIFGEALRKRQFNRWSG